MKKENTTEKVTDIDYAQCAVPADGKKRISDHVHDHAWDSPFSRQVCGSDNSLRTDLISMDLLSH